MSGSTARWLPRLASPRRPEKEHSNSRVVLTVLLRLASAALLLWIGYIHLHLWQEGYRQIPTDGPFFLLDAVVAALFAGALLAWPRPLAGLLAAGFTASTIGALVISLTVGLFGFKESISASFVMESLVIETITAVMLLGWTALVAARLPQDGAQPAGRTARGVMSGS
jgi:hypothetical protein